MIVFGIPDPHDVVERQPHFGQCFFQSRGLVDVPDRGVEVKLSACVNVIVIELARADDDVAHAKLWRTFEAADALAVQRRDARLNPVANVALRRLDFDLDLR